MENFVEFNTLGILMCILHLLWKSVKEFVFLDVLRGTKPNWIVEQQRTEDAILIIWKDFKSKIIKLNPLLIETVIFACLLINKLVIQFYQNQN